MDKEDKTLTELIAELNATLELLLTCQAQGRFANNDVQAYQLSERITELNEQILPLLQDET